MSSRAWVAAIALGLVLAASAYAQPVDGNTGNQQRGNQAQEQPASDRDKAPTPTFKDILGRIASALEAQINKPESPEERDRAKRDLAAQEGMAKWAMAMILVGGGELVVTGFGVFLIWRTLRYTRDAAIAARDAVTEARAATVAAQQSAEWAEESVNVARENGEAQVRAYLAVEETIVMIERDGVLHQIELLVHNTGQSPAKNTTFTGEIALVVDGLARTMPIDHDGEAPKHGVDIASGQTKPVTRMILHFDLREREILAWKNYDAVAIELAIRLRFFDAFGHLISEPQHWFGLAHSRAELKGLKLERVPSKKFPEDQSAND